jgi:hypothetical protein
MVWDDPSDRRIGLEVPNGTSVTGIHNETMRSCI